MEVKSLKFKTNIHCEECVKEISPSLDQMENIYKWDVDLRSPDKILSVTGKDLHSNTIRRAVHSAGYHASSIRGGLRLLSFFSKSKNDGCCHD